MIRISHSIPLRSTAFPIISKLADLVVRRRTVKALGNLDDYMLHDIGLTRADIEAMRRLW